MFLLFLPQISKKKLEGYHLLNGLVKKGRSGDSINRKRRLYDIYIALHGSVNSQSDVR